MLTRDFLSGHYQKTITGFLDSAKTPVASEIPGLVGSLCFSGRLLEGSKIYKDHYQVLNDNEKSACRFFLGLGYTRKSQYKEAFKVFRKNLQSLHSASNPLQLFYVYQGIAFYLFFLGKLEISMKWALKSFDSAMDSKDLYARSLATDLLAHLKLRLGEINVGLDLLKTASSLASKTGNKSILEAIEIARLQYQAHYGYDRKNILKTLENKFEQLVSEDNYSRAGIGLELARQYTLRARYDLCEKILEAISPIIFATENRRQEIQLNLRFAENYYQMGKSGSAWNYLRTARRCLNFEADKSFEIQITGFEYKLFDQETRKGIKNQLQESTKLFNTIINHNILSRNKIATGHFLNHEDLYHNFITSIDQDGDQVAKILESGYYTLLWEALQVKRGENLFYFDQAVKRVILFYENKIEVSEGHLTPADTKILLAILKGKNTKSEICKSVWGYEYDPLRHDNIIYTGVRSLRKNLGTGGNWIETTENGYKFINDGKFMINDPFQSLASEVNDSDVNLKEEGIESFLSQLNLRQIKSLQYLKKHSHLDVANYQKLFKVTEVTASRDLRSLKKLGFVVTVGKARAVKYLLA